MPQARLVRGTSRAIVSADQFNVKHLRTHVAFQYPADFVRVSDTDGILSVSGAAWFVALLRRVQHLEIGAKLYQEDWGVALSATRSGRRYWIGLSMWPEGEHAWLAHFHHGSFSWVQRFAPSGKRDIEAFIEDVHHILAADSDTKNIRWYTQDELNGPHAAGNSEPQNA